MTDNDGLPARGAPIRLSVWAPHAHRMRARLATAMPGDRDATTDATTMANTMAITKATADVTAETVAMTPGSGGYWHVDVAGPPGAGHLDYGFLVDEDPRPLPDPRSAWQPHGVHGPSRWVDPADFAWTDQGWPGPRGGAGALGGIHYEMHVGTFTPEGTFDAAAAKLGHLVELGVEVVALMPVAAFPGRWGWGYDGVHLYAVHHPYGGPHALARFVDACHAAGLGVSLDVVYNHLGPVGNYLARFGPYFSTRHTSPWGPALDLDGPDSRPVRRWVLDNAVRWLRDFHIDALRLDATHEMHDTSGRHLLAELSDEVAARSAALGRPLALVAESDRNDPQVITPTAAGGLGMSAQWDDDIHHAIHVAVTGETQGYYADFAEPGALAKTLAEVFFHDGRWSSFRGTTWGAPVARAGLDAHRFVAFLQTHDQVGNRPAGDRIHHGITAAQHAGAAAIYLLSPYTPMLFMGEEWAAGTPWQFFTDFDPAEPVAGTVRSGRCAEFARHGWASQLVPDPQHPSTRAASVLDWTEPADPAHARMLRWYRDLIALRRAEPTLGDGRLDRLEVTQTDRWFLLHRGPLTLVVSFAGQPQTVPCPGADRSELRLAWEPEQVRRHGDEVTVGPHGVAVISR